MCGDLEEEAQPDEEVYARFVAHVHSFLAGLKRKGKSQDEIHAHLDKLFRELLLSTVDEKKAPEDMSGYQRVAMEPLVFARLAGFIAAHVPLAEDPLRRVMEALMVGYSEGEIVLAHDHDHDHDGHAGKFHKTTHPSPNLDAANRRMIARAICITWPIEFDSPSSLLCFGSFAGSSSDKELGK